MRYRRRPYDVMALQWTGKNVEEIKKFRGSNAYFDGASLWIFDEKHYQSRAVHVGNYVVKDPRGHLYIRTKEDFEYKYSPVLEETGVSARPRDLKANSEYEWLYGDENPDE